MKFQSTLLAVLSLVCPNALAFVGNARSFVSSPRRASSSRSSASSLNMVADDAKVVLVTGSSRGLGKAIALEIGKAGQKVVVNYVSDGSKGAAEDTVAEIKALGGDAIAIQADSTCFRVTFVYLVGRLTVLLLFSLRCRFGWLALLFSLSLARYNT